MGAYLDLAGKRYGRLNVIADAGRSLDGRVMWLCRCDCGSEKVIRGSDIKIGKTLSCGCLAAEVSGRKPAPIEKRFYENIFPVPESGCWLWVGNVSTFGYGTIYHKGKSRRAHRISYEMHVGPVPEGLVLDHLCRVRCCVNPAHLEPVTNAENSLRGYGIPARNSRKTHCLNGHGFTPENTRIKRNGQRKCRVCEREEAKRIRDRKRRLH